MLPSNCGPTAELPRGGHGKHGERSPLHGAWRQQAQHHSTRLTSTAFEDGGEIFALDHVLPLERPSKTALERAMAEHALATATLIGTSQKALTRADTRACQ